MDRHLSVRRPALAAGSMKTGPGRGDEEVRRNLSRAPVVQDPGMRKQTRTGAKVCRMLLLAVLVMSGLIYPTRDAFACSCAEQPSDRAAARHSDLVFSGRVTDTAGPVFSQGRAGFGFEVDRVYRGRAFSTQWVYSGTEGDTCGMEFDLGHRYVVFAYFDNDRRPSTGICTNTRELDANEEPDLQAAGTLIPGRSRTTPPSIFLALLTVAAGVLAYRLGKKHHPG